MSEQRAEVAAWPGLPVQVSRLVPEGEMLVLGNPPQRIILTPLRWAQVQFHQGIRDLFDAVDARLAALAGRLFVADIEAELALRDVAARLSQPDGSVR